MRYPLAFAGLLPSADPPVPMGLSGRRPPAPRAFPVADPGLWASIRWHYSASEVANCPVTAQTVKERARLNLWGAVMSFDTPAAPDMLPVLSRGKHRSPKKGACFMELASYLAGERWSDHPPCTHALLATEARLVNDFTSDAARPRLAQLIPAVIGLTSDDLRVDVTIALRAARTALPVASAERQRVLAVAVLTCERVLAHLDGRPLDEVSRTSLEALDSVPHAEKWARRFTRGMRVSPKGFRRHAGPSAVRCAVQGIARACIPAADDMLYDLLISTIDDCERLIKPARPEVDPLRWTEACDLTR